jgi:large subunit ribosomal protein L6
MTITIPDGVSVERVGDEVRVKGPKGNLSEQLSPLITTKIEGSEVVVSRLDEARETRALHGLSRALIANMVQGVVKPFFKELEIQGVGYRAEANAKVLKLTVGFSHPYDLDIPQGLKVSVDKNTNLRIEGISRQQVGQFAADVRSVRPPEPYKGKGIRYVNERVLRKAGKAATGSS